MDRLQQDEHDPVGAAPIALKTIDGHRQRRVQEAEARTEALRTATAENATKAREAYEEGIRKEEARIAYWRRKADARVGSVDMGYAKMVADDLQRRLDERIARDEIGIRQVPAARSKKRRDRIKKDAEKNRLDLGFPVQN